MSADNSKLVYGGDMMLFAGSGSAKYPMAFSTSAKLDVSLKTREISSKDSADWTDKLGGRFDWNASTDGLLSFAVSGSSNSVDALFTYMVAKQPINMVFASKSGTSPYWTVDSAKKNFTGLAIITALNMNSADGENGTYSCTMEGCGLLTMA